MDSVDRAHIHGCLGVKQTFQVLPATGGDQSYERHASQPVEPDGARGEPSYGAVCCAHLRGRYGTRGFPIAEHNAEADRKWQSSRKEEIVAQQLAPGLGARSP